MPASPRKRRINRLFINLSLLASSDHEGFNIDFGTQIYSGAASCIFNSRLPYRAEQTHSQLVRMLVPQLLEQDRVESVLVHSHTIEVRLRGEERGGDLADLKELIRAVYKRLDMEVDIRWHGERA